MDYVFLYQHTMRAEWGYGAVIDTQDDRTTFKFDDGVSRTIKRDHMHLMVQVELDEPEGSEVRKRLARSVKSAASRVSSGGLDVQVSYRSFTQDSAISDAVESYASSHA